MAKALFHALALPAVCICLGISCAGSGQARSLDPAEGKRRQVELFPQRGHSFSVSSLAYSPDGRFVVSGSADSSVKIWDLEKGREMFTLPEHEGPVRSVAYSPDGKRVLSGSTDYTIRLWDAETGEELKTLTGHSNVVNSVAYSPDGRSFVSGSTDRTVKVWDAESGRMLRTFLGHSLWVNDVCYSPDGRSIASASRDGTVKLWSVENGDLLRTLSGYAEALTVRFSPDGRFIASGFADSAIIMWDALTGRELRTLTGHEGAARTLVFSPDGRYIASASSVDSTIRIWDAGTGSQIRSFGIAGIETLHYSPNGKYLASGSLDNAVRIWEAGTGREILTLAGRSSWERSVAYSPDGKHLALGSTDRTVRIWETRTGRNILTLAGHTATVRSVAYSPDGKRVVSGAADSSVRVWDAASGRELMTLRGHGSVVRAVTYDLEGRFILSGSSDTTVKVWDAQTGEDLWTFTGHAGEVNALACSPDGFYIASGSSDRTVKIWDVAGGPPRTFRGHASAVVSLAYSPNGARLASGSADGTVKLWDLVTGGELGTISGYSTRIKSSVAYSPNGVFLAATMANNTVSIFSAESGVETRVLRGHIDEVYDLAYSPNGRHLVSASLDGTTRVWDLSTGRELAQSVGFSNGEWITITPDGYYAASVWGDRYFNIRVGSNVYGLELYRPLFYNPYLVHSRLQGRKIRDNRSLQNINTFGVPPTLSIAGPADGSQLTSATAELLASAEDQSFPLQSFRIYLNDRLIGADLMAGLAVTAGLKPAFTGIAAAGKLREASFQLPLELDPGTNRIDVTVSNGYAEGSASVTVETPGYLSRAQPHVLPNLKILSIGISRYDDPRIDHLGFAVFDAREIINAFKTQEGKFYGTVTTLLLATGELQPPTKNNILRELSVFFQDLGSHDTALVFLSGHGVNDDDGNYFFLPADIRLNSDGGIPFQEALSAGDIAAALDVPGRRLLFVDSSHTQGISAVNIRPVDADRLAMVLKSLRPLVFTAGRGDEFSAESAEYKAGLFGYALKEGLGGKADSNGNRIVAMQELDDYVSGRVSDLSGALQHPSTHSQGYVDFDLLSLE
ncbi:MAG: caspase family protein [Treponema sp.]|jgi:WD40 repeat protein|nr:caspase family protein [Treponema sp.]